MNSDLNIITRFAPSPTGDLHLGSLRTALFNWLWAKKNNGIFILRLEDTDQTRLIKGASEKLLSDLQTLGLSWDFGPNKDHPQFGNCIQSHRLKLYQDIANKLIDQGIAYYDFTTPKQLESLRKQSQINKQSFIFRKNMAQLKPQTINQKPVIRIAMPNNLTIKWQDTIKGNQSWNSSDIGDFIILKSDGWPTYHLANVIDDYHMQISHVIRADEWLSSTPKHIYLFNCLKWDKPQYVHVPPILAPGGKKLSKRDQGGRVADLLENGYLKEALLNYIALLGWNPKTEQEIFSITELIKAFNINHIRSSGANFDITRLNWFNGQHLRKLDFDDLKIQAENWWPTEAGDFDQIYKDKVLKASYKKIKTLSELKSMTHFFFKPPDSLRLEELIKETKLDEKQINNLTNKTMNILKDSDLSLGDLELKLYQITDELQVSPSKYFTLLRLKLTSQKVAPGIFEIINILGYKEVKDRLYT